MFSLLAKNIQLSLICVGLALIVTSQLFDLHLLKIDVDQLCANVGALILFVGALQWIFESRAKQALISEVVDRTLNTTRVSRAGIHDFLANSKDVNYERIITESNELTIGLNYAPRIIDDHIEEFRARCAKGLKTTIMCIDVESSAGKYISSIDEEAAHIEPNLEKLKRAVHDLNNNGAGVIELIKHRSVLRYSFVVSDFGVVIKPYRNSRGRCRIPAIKVTPGTEFYNFLTDDIKNLKRQTDI